MKKAVYGRDRPGYRRHLCSWNSHRREAISNAKGCLHPDGGANGTEANVGPDDLAIRKSVSVLMNRNAQC